MKVYEIKMQDKEIFGTKFETPLGIMIGMGDTIKLQSLKFAKDTILEGFIPNYKNIKFIFLVKQKNGLMLIF